MPRSRALRLSSLGLLAPLALAATPSVPAAPAAAPGAITTVAQASDEVLAQLPRNAAEAGLTYAPNLVQVRAPSQADRSVVAASGLDVTEHAGDGFVEVVLHSVEDEAALAALGFSSRVVTEDLIAQEYERILADVAYFRSTPVSPVPSGRTTYRVLADFGQEIDALVAAHPAVAKRISVGSSIEGRDLTGIEIGVGVNDPEDGRPVFLMFGNHHAREWPSAETPMEFAHDLLQNFAAGDARTVDLLSRTRAIIVPVSNPDGFDASRTSGDLIDFNAVDGGGTVSILATPGNAYKRKNCRIQNGETQPAGGCVAFSSPGGMGIGIDLNRNYGGLWGGPGADASFQSATYRGPAPFSEPETQAIRTLISTRQVTTLISNHTFSNLLLRPVGVQPDTLHPDGFPIGFAPDECFIQADGRDNGMQALGERMTAQTGYSNQFGWELYDTTGTTEDYSYNATGGYGYTFEIGPDQFHPAFEHVVAEYTGGTDTASGLTPEAAPFLTSSQGQNCGAAKVTSPTAGGGLREAYYIALENAADVRTHSVLTGTAPAGAEIQVERSGTFPLWDGTPFDDTVATSMVVGSDGTFEYHVNPSTRPFVAPRAYALDPAVPPTVQEVSSTSESGITPAGGEPTDVPIQVDPGMDSITVTLDADLFSDDYDLTLISPTLIVLGSSANGGSDEIVSFTRPGGIQPGEYVARVVNFAAAGPWNLEASVGVITQAGEDPVLDLTPGLTELWTVTCRVDGTEAASVDVEVARGGAVDLGSLCGGAPTPAPAPAPQPAPAPLPVTGGGAAIAGLLALIGSARLRRS